MPHINDLIAVAKAGWLGLLAYLAFVGVTLIGVEDADFFIVERRTQLPLIGVTIPTSLFFAIAPGLGAMLYTYLHLYLLKLWEALAEAPATWNKAAIGDSIRPWMIADYALSFRKDAPIRPRPLRGLANAVSGLLIFWAAPAVLAGFWWRSMPKHDEVLTVIFCGIPLCVSVYVGVASWLRLARLSCGDATPLEWRKRGKAAWTAFSSVVALAGWLTTEGTLDNYARRLGIQEKGWWNTTPFPGFLVPAQLAGISFVETPSDWKVYEKARHDFRLLACKEEGLAPSVCGEFYAESSILSIPRTSMRLAWCKQKFAEDSQDINSLCQEFFSILDARLLFEWVNARQDDYQSIKGLDLSGADLRGANLAGAVLDGSALEGVRLQGANLENARLEGANLSLAQMDNVTLSSARMEMAILIDASMVDANLYGTRLEGAELSSVRLESARLEGTRLEGAILQKANMRGAYLLAPHLEGADFTGTILENAYLGIGTSEVGFVDNNPYLVVLEIAPVELVGVIGLSEARLKGAALHGVDLSEVGLSNEQLSEVFGDRSVEIPPNLKRPVHWPTAELDWSEFHGEWTKWRDDPAGYRPPPPPSGQ